MVILDSGAVTALSERSHTAMARLRELDRQGHWPPVVPTVVVAECLTGDVHRDVRTYRLLKHCKIRDDVSMTLARRAGRLRSAARQGSVVDALVVAYAEPGGVALTRDHKDLRPLAEYADRVAVESP